MDKGTKDVSVLTVSQCKTVKGGMLEVFALIISMVSLVIC